MTFKEFSDQSHAMVEAVYPKSYHSAVVEETRNGTRSLLFKVWVPNGSGYVEAPNARDCLTALKAKLDAMQGIPADTESVGECESIA